MRKAKYNARKFRTLDGVFDSKEEYDRWLLLNNMQDEGIISDLDRQVAFELIPKQELRDPRIYRRSKQKSERSMRYIADFVYMKDGKRIVEDVKPKDKLGYVDENYKRTQAWKEYVIKRKLMLFIHGIEIKEV